MKSGELTTTARACSSCGVLYEPRSENPCAFCRRNIRKAVTGTSPGFLAHLGLIINALDMPRLDAMLRSFAGVAVIRYGFALCFGCNTVTDKRGSTFCQQHEKTIACTNAWCRPQRMGVLACSICHGTFCGECVHQCYTCGGPTGCKKCRTRYECEECVEHFCAWCAPPRRPHRQAEGDVAFLCDDHIAWDLEWHRITANCHQCNAFGIGLICSQCKNPVCEHSDDSLCYPCQQNKRARLE